MSLKLSEQEFNKLLNEKKIKINKNSINNFSQSSDKININGVKKNVKNPVDFDKVINSIINSSYEFYYNSDEIYILLKDARLLSINQILSFLQQKPVPIRMMKYKKIWHEKMSTIIKDIIFDSIENKKTLPNFNGNVVNLLLYRESLKLIDEDSISVSFKYIIDSLRKEHIFLNKSYNILSDDNQMVVAQISPYQVKSKNNNIAIKIVKSVNKPIVSNVSDFFLKLH